jgi:hypothetical protein
MTPALDKQNLYKESAQTWRENGGTGGEKEVSTGDGVLPNLVYLVMLSAIHSVKC